MAAQTLVSKIISCPLCQSEKFSKKYEFTTPVQYEIVRCKRCGLVYMNPQLPAAVLDSFYSDERYYTGGAAYTYSDERRARASYRLLFHSRLRSIERFASKGNLLDVGCSFGGFLECARERGWNVYGLDVSQPVIDHVQALGITAFCGTLRQSTYADNFFDCITMVEVVEHLPDPLADLRTCFQKLKPGGWLIIQTGNIDSLSSKVLGKKFSYYLPGHVVYFSPATLTRMLRQAGFGKFHQFAGDAIPYSDRIRSIILSEHTSKEKVKRVTLWTAYYIARKIVFNRPILGSITIYAKKLTT